jgi:hypothetical protein
MGICGGDHLDLTGCLATYINKSTFNKASERNNISRGKPGWDMAGQGKAQQTVWIGGGRGERLCWFNDAGMLDARNIYTRVRCVTLDMATTRNLVSWDRDREEGGSRNFVITWYFHWCGISAKCEVRESTESDQHKT